jgi:hypothetical protein
MQKSLALSGTSVIISTATTVAIREARDKTNLPRARQEPIEKKSER